MRIMRSRSRRVAAFIAATGGAIALVGIAAGSTGAYFTDVHAGSINGTFGKVALSVDGVVVAPGDSATGGKENLEIQWNSMLPGSNKTVSWTVTNTGTANESIWLAFDDSNGEWTAINTLGSYGDARINSPLLNADYNNLNNKYPQGTPANPGQHNACGDQQPAIAYLPAENHVADLAPGGSASFTFSFGYGPCLSDNSLQGGPAFANPLLYDIIATQQGITPDDSHNGGVYTPPSDAHI
jgi:hypothetical protein